MSYLTLGIHQPKPEHVQNLLDATRRIAELARQQPGLIETGAWIDEASGRVVVLSLWESEAAANAARPKLAPLVRELPFGQWEQGAVDRMVHLTRAV